MITMFFPKVKGSNLEKKKYHIPEDLEGEINIVTVAFQQWHQGLVNTWVPYLEELKESFNEVSFYEFPTINRGYKGMRFMIDGGMRMGIPDKIVRSRTITLYLNKHDFMNKLDIRDDQNITTFLLDNEGKIILKIDGEYNPEKGELITNKIKELIRK